MGGIASEKLPIDSTVPTPPTPSAHVQVFILKQIGDEVESGTRPVDGSGPSDFSISVRVNSGLDAESAGGELTRPPCVYSSCALLERHARPSSKLAGEILMRNAKLCLTVLQFVGSKFVGTHMSTIVITPYGKPQSRYGSPPRNALYEFK